MERYQTLAVALAAAVWMGATGASAAGIEQADALNRRTDTQRLLNASALSTNAPEIFSGESTDVGPQYVLKRVERRKYFEAIVDSQFLFTSNAELTEHKSLDSTLFVNTAEIALAPTPYETDLGNLGPRFGYRNQWINYSLENGDRRRMDGRPLSDNDLVIQTFFADLRWQKNNWMGNVGLEWTRLLEHANYNEFYKEWAPRWELVRLLPLSESKYFTLAYQGSYRASDTDPAVPGMSTSLNDRLENSFLAAYTHTLIPKLDLQPYYRFTHSHYTGYEIGPGPGAARDRNDLLHTFGLSAFYYFTPKFSARLFTAYDIRESDELLTADYRKFDLGLGLNFNIQF